MLIAIFVKVRTKMFEMKKISVSFALLVACNNSNEKTNYNFEAHFEVYGELETATYEQVIQYYTNLDWLIKKVKITKNTRFC